MEITVRTDIYIYICGEPYPVDILYPSCFLNINETDMSNKANKFDFYWTI